MAAGWNSIYRGRQLELLRIPRAHQATEGGERACNIVYGEVQNKFKNSMSARYSCTYMRSKVGVVFALCRLHGIYCSLHALSPPSAARYALAITDEPGNEI